MKEIIKSKAGVFAQHIFGPLIEDYTNSSLLSRNKAKDADSTFHSQLRKSLTQKLTFFIFDSILNPLYKIVY